MAKVEGEIGGIYTSSHLITVYFANKSNQVVFWVNQVPHYGNRTTSRNESSHAAIKAYLGTSSGDHKHFFDAISLFWEDQHRDITEAIGQAKIKPRTTHNIQFFQDVIAFVHPFVLELILKERGKLPRKPTDPLLPCTCTVQVCLGIPCFHTIRERQNGSGLLQLSDIDCHWYYDRNAAGPVPNRESRRILLNPNPANVKKKGRPKGTKKQLPKRKGNGESSTRRDPSLFEHEALELPSITAPPRLESTNPPPAKRMRTLPSRADAASIPASTSTSTPMPATTRITQSTTKLALARGLGGPDDPYVPGTQRERAYMRSVHADKLAEAEIYEDEESDCSCHRLCP